VADYRLRVDVTIKGETNMTIIRDWVLSYLKDQKEKGNIKEGMYSIGEEPATELYTETGEI